MKNFFHSLALLAKNQWLFAKKYGVKKEIARIKKRVSWFAENYVFKSTFREKAAEDLRIVNKVLKEKNIPFYLDFGTCLGAVREGDFIAWDDDVDLGVIEDTPASTIEEVKQALAKEGFEILEYQNHYRGCSKIICKRRVPTTILWFQKEKGYFVWRDEERKGAVEFQAPAHLLGKFREARLAGDGYLVPDPPEAYLDARYENWRVPQKRAATNMVVE